MLAKVIFWIAVIIPLYAFAGYPLVLLGLGLLIRRPVGKAPIWPKVSLLIPAYNEARVIARKIENSRALEYPADRIEIVVVSDGSSDETVDILRETKSVRMLALPTNSGKMAALNAAVPKLRGEIVVFSDASAMLASDAVRVLMENFAARVYAGRAWPSARHSQGTVSLPSA
jgi:cellulose synthase/poly-beta-1,6-N-acetylglucosamine synthase-like glycosyltransferase